MKNKIIKKLHEIEKEHNIKIFYAIESGSRAWGFASKDSDYDVRFIYVHPVEWYLSIEKKRDVIEYPVQDLLDFSGWDIRKALQLYKKSNPPLYEWLVSPIIYIENGSFAQQLRELTPTFYSPITSTYHYLHMAERNYREYLKKDIVRIKKYFYVLRPIFACMWIKQYKTQPPMEFMKMLKSLPIDKAVTGEIEKLYARKIAGDELDKEKKIPIINQFLDDKIEYYKSYVKEIHSNKNTKTDMLLLDKLFQETLKNTQ